MIGPLRKISLAAALAASCFAAPAWAASEKAPDSPSAPKGANIPLVPPLLGAPLSSEGPAPAMAAPLSSPPQTPEVREAQQSKEIVPADVPPDGGPRAANGGASMDVEPASWSGVGDAGERAAASESRMFENGPAGLPEIRAHKLLLGGNQDFEQMLEMLQNLMGSSPGLRRPAPPELPATRERTASEAWALHGPTLREYEKVRRPSAAVKRYWLYARTPEGANERTNYFANAEASHKAFQTWLRGWLDGRSVSYDDWVAHIKARHLIATGADGGRFHEGPGGYSTHEVYPGQLRSEAEVREGNSQTDPEFARHVDRWLAARGYKAEPQVGGRTLEFQGLVERLGRTGRRLRAATFEPDFTYGKVRYPHARDLDVFLELSFEQLAAAKDDLVRLKAGRGPPPALKDVIADPLFDHLADYYHTAITGHFFHKTNNSMLMPEIDSFLEELGLPPVPQGWLDIVAIRMDYRPFREYFREYLLHYVDQGPSKEPSVSVESGGPRRELRLGGKIGEGVMGEVFEAHDAATGERFVVKTFRKIRRAEGWREPLAIEADALRRVRHPVLPAAVGMGVMHGADGPEDVLVLNFIEGRPIGVASELDPLLPFQTSIGVALRVLDAAAALHRAGLRHNDITPANIMIEGDRPETTRLIDLGNVTPIGEAFTAGHGMFAPPEQLMRQAEAMKGRVTADTYAVGAVLLNMLTGLSPADAGALDRVPKMTAWRGLKRLTLRGVIERALAAAPAARYQSAEEFRRDLEIFSGD